MRYAKVTEKQLDTLVSGSIANFRDHAAVRDSAAQCAVEHAIEACYREGELELAATLVCVSVCRCRNDLHDVLTFLLQREADRAAAYRDE